MLSPGRMREDASGNHANNPLAPGSKDVNSKGLQEETTDGTDRTDRRNFRPQPTNIPMLSLIRVIRAIRGFFPIAQRSSS